MCQEAQGKQEEEAATKIQAAFALILRSEAAHADPCKQAIHRGNLARKATSGGFGDGVDFH